MSAPDDKLTNIYLDNLAGWLTERLGAKAVRTVTPFGKQRACTASISRRTRAGRAGGRGGGGGGLLVPVTDRREAWTGYCVG